MLFCLKNELLEEVLSTMSFEVFRGNLMSEEISETDGCI